jgi:hypothetical protein
MTRHIGSIRLVLTSVLAIVGAIALFSTPAAAQEICNLNPTLGLVDGNGDGLVTRGEIQALVDASGGAEGVEQLQQLLNSWPAGLTGIRYTGCTPDNGSGNGNGNGDGSDNGSGNGNGSPGDGSGNGSGSGDGSGSSDGDSTGDSGGNGGGDGTEAAGGNGELDPVTGLPVTGLPVSGHGVSTTATASALAVILASVAGIMLVAVRSGQRRGA